MLGGMKLGTWILLLSLKEKATVFLCSVFHHFIQGSSKVLARKMQLLLLVVSRNAWFLPATENIIIALLSTVTLPHVKFDFSLSLPRNWSRSSQLPGLSS